MSKGASTPVAARATTSPAVTPVVSVNANTPAPAPTPVVKPAVATVDFEKQVQPFFTQYCYACHGPAAAFPPGGVKLSSKKSTMRAIDPGSPFTSLLFKVIWKGTMPPRGQRQPTAAQVAMLQQWITEGAPWPEEPTP